MSRNEELSTNLNQEQSASDFTNIMQHSAELREINTYIDVITDMILSLSARPQCPKIQEDIDVLKLKYAKFANQLLNLTKNTPREAYGRMSRIEDFALGFLNAFSPKAPDSPTSPSHRSPF